MKEAAGVMELELHEVVAMVRRGELEHREEHERGLLVRPAVVRKLAVRS